MLDNIKWLHVEPTTRCNAWCSSCSRNKNGYGLTNFKIQDLDPQRLQDVIDKCTKLQTVQFCGNRGDPCASKCIDKQLDVVHKKGLHLQIHTNGSLRTKEWWGKLAEQFKDKLVVWFAIDGLEDTHSKYRQGTDWKKIIGNAKEFIDRGGRAVWQFIPFQHNEHQMRDCMKMSTRMGFERFEFVKNARYPKNAFDYKTGKEIVIKPWSKHQDQWSRKSGILQKITDSTHDKIQVQRKNCMHLILPSIFLSANGNINPCCYFNVSLNDLDIEASINKKSYYKTCLEACGS